MNLIIQNKSLRSSEARLMTASQSFPCAIGKSGITASKREGDGATPLGAWPLLFVLYRPDRIRRPITALPVKAISPDDGWCDDPADRNYNRPVKRPYPASTETLWRDDNLYDLIVVLDYNFSTRIKGRGSAIFLHVAKEKDGRLQPTEGCVALPRPKLLRLMQWLSLGDKLIVRP